ncbi:MAG TPA: DUF3662 and FHA domain-containing protein [Thermoleophilia bacterium]|nr:DUF3662 and FHA domain-containing protein [Thermoleophilia bacterium]
MGIFRKANNKLEGLVEGGFGRAFKSSVQPVELAHKLAKEMGDQKTVGVSNVYVPNEFDVYLGKDDYEHLVSFEDSLKVELSNYVTAFARREGWTLVAPPRIDLHCDEDLRVGEFGIATRTVSEPDEAPVAAALAPPAASVAPGPGIEQTVLYQGPVAAAAPVAAPARTSSARAVLRGREGDYTLSEAVTVIGRSRRCGIVLTDPNVSRQHAEIRRQDDGFMLLDLGSTNGTRVNRRDVKQVVLQHGDRIEFGTTEFLFERQP